MARKQLIKQLIEQLRLDTGPGSLVALTGHKATDIRIGRDQPPVKEKTPYLGIRAFSGIPVLGFDVTFLKTETILIRAYSRDEVKTIEILDRVEALLHDISGGNTGFYDFSSNASDGVSIRMSRYTNRTDEEFSSELDVWVSTVLVDVIWVPLPCPEIP